MSARPPGRRTESLFDNRYRYDHIFPRGRSGETLRAYDTYDHDRPVVVKRPAPQDAPPMRAGQEVSIRIERRALERLSGHAVLTEICGGGTFRVGGHTHDYIVMELATGEIVEDMVLALAKEDRLLPELEALVIVDRLLDLLAFAHDRQVIYNDVDAKHLFWSRDAYQLKVIDWGNAVFLDEPGAQASVTRATDVYQCGELLYFILTGGNRLVTETDEAGEAFSVNFGAGAERIPARLQAIVTRAVHADPKRRYRTIGELRQALIEYRQPLEKARDELISRLRRRVRPTASQEELAQLLDELQEALAMDPGYPEARALADEIHRYRQQIMVQADLDAIRIYLESGNWPRALSLLDDLLPHADPTSEPLIRFLIAAAALSDQLHVTPPPAGFDAALDPLFVGEMALAGQKLLTTPEPRPTAQEAQWLIAEQLSALTDVILLRPHLVRLKRGLREAKGAAPLLALVEGVEEELERAPLAGLASLQVHYQGVADELNAVAETLDRFRERWSADQQAALIASVDRARDAASAIVARLDAVSRTAVSDPMQAGEQLRGAAAIDPLSPYFDAVNDYLDEVHQAIDALSQFKPRPDGSNLAGWFEDVEEFLAPYLADLQDPQLHSAAESVRQAAESWNRAASFIALGRRQPTIETLRSTAEMIRALNGHIAAWLGTVANRLPDAQFVERHSANTKLADALVEGWKAWDRGDMAHAAEEAERAHDAARTDGERMAADHLRRLTALTAGWLASGKPNREAIDQTERDVLALLLSEEEQERRTFAEQMPNTTLYLRAMGRGIVAYMHQSSSAGWRALYTHYVLRGVLAMLDEDLEEADFWRNAASKTYEDAPMHPVYQVLDRALTGRRLVETAEAALNAVAGPADLDRARRALNAPLASELLAGAEQSTQMAIQAVRDWSDGDFYAAQQSLDVALEDIQRAIAQSELQIDSYVEWLTRLRDTAAELQQAKLTIEQQAAKADDTPDPAVGEAHRAIVDRTLLTLGPDYAHQVRQWQDMYQSVHETYTTQRLSRSEKMAAFDRHFGSLFINKHPAYPLFRHWESVIEELPPDEPEDTVIAVETPDVPLREEGEQLTFLLDDAEPEPAEQPRPRPAPRESGDLPWNWIIVGAVIVLVAAIGFAVIRSRETDDRNFEGGSAAGANRRPTATNAPTAATATQPAAVVDPASDTPEPTDIPATPTATAPRVTPTPSPAPTEDDAATPTRFVTSTLAPSQINAAEALPNDAPPETSILAALDALPPDDRPWESDLFSPGAGGSWTLASAGPADVVRIELTPALLSDLFQPGVANTLSSARAVLELAAYDDEAMAAGEVALGLGAENASGQSVIGAIRFLEPDRVGMGLNQNGVFNARTEASLDDTQVELSLERINANTLGFFVDSQLLGDSVIVFPEGSPITLVLYASGEGTTVDVSAFEIEFSPRSELP